MGDTPKPLCTPRLPDSLSICGPITGFFDRTHRVWGVIISILKGLVNIFQTPQKRIGAPTGRFDLG